MSDKREPDPERRRDDEQALEEIRRLFDRYRRVARHRAADERDDEPAAEGRLAGVSASNRR
jgi:hypothetical protein